MLAACLAHIIFTTGSSPSLAQKTPLEVFMACHLQEAGAVIAPAQRSLAIQLKMVLPNLDCSILLYFVIYVTYRYLRLSYLMHLFSNFLVYYLLRMKNTMKFRDFSLYSVNSA